MYSLFLFSPKYIPLDYPSALPPSSPGVDVAGVDVAGGRVAGILVAGTAVFSTGALVAGIGVSVAGVREKSCEIISTIGVDVTAAHTFISLKNVPDQSHRVVSSIHCPHPVSILAINTTNNL